MAHPAVAIGDEESLGQRVGIHRLQKVLQGHALPVHPASHIQPVTIAAVNQIIWDASRTGVCIQSALLL